MGTNYYATDGTHIGKRSAAGWYCWDCGVTLCGAGEEHIHESAYNHTWYKECPICGKKPPEESLREGAIGRELGFNKKPYERKKGVHSCSSFTWAVDPRSIDRKRIIINEYGDRFTLDEFKQILEECPVQFTNLIGKEFS